MSMLWQKNKMSDDASDFMSKKIKYLMEEEGMEQKQAVAVAYKMAEKEGYKVPKKTKAAEESLETFKNDLFEAAKKYFGNDDGFDENVLKKNIEKDIEETEEMIGKKILKVNMAGSIDEGVELLDILFEGDEEYTPADVWFDYYDDMPGINIHIHDYEEDEQNEQEEE